MGLYSNEVLAIFRVRMKSIRTIVNRFYVATVTEAASITDAATGHALARTDKAAQVAFLAIGSRTDISDDEAVVVPAHCKTASFGASAGSSSPPGLTDMVQACVASAFDKACEDIAVLTTARGAYENECDAVTLAARHLRPGRLCSVTLTAAERADKSPCYLAVQERTSSGPWSSLGFSTNVQAMRLGLACVWEFDDVELSGRDLRLIATPDRESDVIAQRRLLHLRAGTRLEGDTSSITYDFVEYPYVAQVALRLAVRGNGWAKADNLSAHAQDATAHVTSDERARWNARADTYVKVEEDDGNSSPSSTGHPSVTRSMTLQSSMWGGSPQIHLFHEGAETTTYGSLELSYRPVLDESKAVRITLPELIGHPSDAAVHISAGERDRWNGSFRSQSREWDRETALPGPENAEGLEQTIYKISFTATNLPGEINLDTMLAAYQTEGLNGHVYRLLIRNDTGRRCTFAGGPSCLLAAPSQEDAALLPGEERLLTVHVFGSMLYCTLGHPFFN